MDDVLKRLNVLKKQEEAKTKKEQQVVMIVMPRLDLNGNHHHKHSDEELNLLFNETRTENVKPEKEVVFHM